MKYKKSGFRCSCPWMIIYPLANDDFVQVGVINRVKEPRHPAFLLKSGAEVWENARDQVAGQTRSCSPYRRGSCSSRLQPAAAVSDKLWYQSDADNQPEWARQTWLFLWQRQSILRSMERFHIWAHGWTARWRLLSNPTLSRRTMAWWLSSQPKKGEAAKTTLESFKFIVCHHVKWWLKMSVLYLQLVSEAFQLCHI